MKRILSFLIATAMSLSFTTVAFAVDAQKTFDSGEIAFLAPEIAATINEAASFDNLFNDAITESDIDFSAAYKVYYDVDVFSTDGSVEDIQTAIEGGEHSWFLPVFKEGKTALLIIGRGLPLSSYDLNRISEDEAARIQANQGQWEVQTTYLYPYTYDLTQNVATSYSSFSQRSPISNATTYIVAGIPEMRSPTAILCAEEGVFIKSAEQSATTTFSTNSFMSFAECKAQLPEKIANGLYGNAGNDVNQQEQIAYGTIFFVVGCIGIISIAIIMLRTKKQRRT